MDTGRNSLWKKYLLRINEISLIYIRYSLPPSRYPVRWRFTTFNKNNQLKNSKMKKTIIITLLCLLAIAGFSQSPFHGFFKPKTALTVHYLKADNQASTSIWLFRPELSMTALAIQLGGSEPVVQSFNSIGSGISYANIDNSTGYCNYSFNAMLITKVNIGNISAVNFGGALTFDVYNKFISLGISYVSGHTYLISQISYSL